MISVAIGMLSGCRDCMRDRTGYPDKGQEQKITDEEKKHDEEDRVADCSIYNNKPEHCNKAMQHDNKKCQYNHANGACVAMPAGGGCASLTKEACEADMNCMWNQLSMTCDPRK